MHSRRALLYMPGDDWKKITKALTLSVDCICMDMEDGVAINRKAEARATIAKALQELDFGASEKLARVNAVGSGLEDNDIQAVLPYHPDGIVIPKVESLDQIQWGSELIEAAELANGWPVNSIRMLVGVETAKGILNLKEIASHSRLDGIIFGGEDFAASIGAKRSEDATELLYARQAVVTACAAYGLQAIDIVTIDFKDMERIRREAEFGAQLGFSGKQIIHPNQVTPVQEAFTPDDESIAYARRVVEAFESHQEKGKGAFALDGQMIDMPLVKNAQKVLERAAKYLDNDSELHIPAPISAEHTEMIQRLAVMSFQALDCSGLARCDFLLEKQTGEIFVNEVNTMPGFTPISMYPKLWEASGISYSELIDRLIELALERHEDKQQSRATFDVSTAE